MTSKLRRTIVGVGIALGGAAPGCFGRSHFDAGDGGAGAAGDSNQEPDAARPDASDTTIDGALDASTDGPIDASRDAALDASRDAALDASADGTIDASTDGSLDASTDGSLDASADGTIDASTDGSIDASTDGPLDPYCDVSWPPTKANPSPGTVPCVDPLHECTDAYPPRRCYRIVDPATCRPEPDYAGPLYCVDGAWRCPPDSDDGERCQCWSADGGGCPDASAGDMPGADGGDAAN